MSTAGSSFRLTLVAVVAVSLLSGIYIATSQLAEEQRSRHELKILGQVLPTELYDNNLIADAIQISDAPQLGGTGPHTVYRAWLDGSPSAAILKVTTTQGYNGEIGLLIGVRTDGTVTGVRVTHHQETPGLADGIEASASDWILQFDDTSLLNPSEADWAVRADGGRFDQLTGATISPRAIVAAVYNGLTYFSDHKDDLFAKPRTTPD